MNIGKLRLSNANKYLWPSSSLAYAGDVFVKRGKDKYGKI